ncbi:MAG: hypothetical protein Q9Q40_06885 [Acidobacteriota bacterium]|nr:hypothetical protein [Acidobacteriota bacterium]MDQ7088273.1 hypothetical protein [Acidobacteriota bacterium]
MMPGRTMLRGGVRAGLVLLGGLCLLPSLQASGETPVEMHLALLAQAWGPETPERLEHFLEVRESISHLVFDRRYQIGIQQWALREAGTMPSFGPALFGVLSMRRETDQRLAERGLTMSDFLRMTILVYGRWLRAVREGPPPEVDVIRALQELEVGLERHLANNPPEKAGDLERLEQRLLAVRHQLRFLRPYNMDEAFKKRVLERIDPATRRWLEEHRERIEAVDFRYFDTAPPAREKTKKKET